MLSGLEDDDTLSQQLILDVFTSKGYGGNLDLEVRLQATCGVDDEKADVSVGRGVSTTAHVFTELGTERM